MKIPVSERYQEEISPSVCVTRLCRFCQEYMKLDYEFDTEYRWYTFTCEDCGITSSLGESISISDVTEDDDFYTDPLTEEEISMQENSIVAEEHRKLYGNK